MYNPAPPPWRSPLIPRSRPLAFALLLAPLLSCAVFGQMKRDARLREQLDAHRFKQPLDAVWPEAQRLVHERGYELVGGDRAVVGAGEQGTIARVFSKGHETRTLGNGRRVLETNNDGKQRRYRVEGTDLGDGTSRVVFVLVQTSHDTSSESEARDLLVELALVDRVEPEEAQRIVATVEPQGR